MDTKLRHELATADEMIASVQDQATKEALKRLSNAVHTIAEQVAAKVDAKAFQ